MTTGLAKRLDHAARSFYLDLLVASDYPHQEPEHVAARWYHLLWLLLPIVGLLMFLESVKAAYRSGLEVK